MNSFKVIAIGILDSNPELVTKHDDIFAQFCLVGTDYAGRDQEGAACEVVTRLWFVAFGPKAKVFAARVRKGDQLIVEAHIRADEGQKYDYSLIVDEFRFGAPGPERRDELQCRGAHGEVAQEYRS